MYPAYIQLVAKWSSPSICAARATGCTTSFAFPAFLARLFKMLLELLRQGTSPQYQNRYLDLVVWYSICQTQPNHIQIVRRQCCLSLPPQVYINLDDGKVPSCPYSGDRYQLDPNAAKHLASALVVVQPGLLSYIELYFTQINTPYLDLWSVTCGPI